MSLLNDLNETFKNKPKSASKSLRELVKSMKTGDRLLVHDPVPVTLERWIRKQAEKRNLNVSFCGWSYNVTFTTKEQEEERRAQAEARANRGSPYDYP